jgi:predicted CopG family antitoxin
MVKTLTIREDVYKKLVAMKSSDESFSELFDRLAESHSPLEVLKRMKGSLDFRTASKKNAFIQEATSKRDERRF